MVDLSIYRAEVNGVPVKQKLNTATISLKLLWNYTILDNFSLKYLHYFICAQGKILLVFSRHIFIWPQNMTIAIKYDYTEEQRKSNFTIWLTALISESDEPQTLSIKAASSATLGVICIGIKE